MADDFNPYHVWLGIPPEEQPANHYRLLGVKPFETSGDVIDSAADRQMAHLRTIQVGKHGDLSQRLLNEVAAARVCLLDPKKRAAYDQQLRAKLAAVAGAASAGATASTAAAVSGIQCQPPRRMPATWPMQPQAAPAANLPQATATPQPADVWDDLLGDPSVEPSAKPGRKSAKAAIAKHDATNRTIVYGLAAAVVIAAAIGIGIFVTGSSPSTGTLVFDMPAVEGATVTIDNAATTIPANGRLEIAPGAHHIAGQRPAHIFSADLTVVAGQDQTAATDWKPKAVLVLNWPIAMRGGAELTIDGHVQTVSARMPLEIAVEPGRHTIEITRPGSAKIETAATVVPDGRKSVAITPPPTTATVLLDWPTDERKDAELTIDGHSQEIDGGTNPFELTVPPGKHVVRIARAGFESFHQSLELSAGANQAIRPTWTPESKAPAVVETAPPAETTRPPQTAPQPVKKLAPPSAAEIERIATQIDGLYKISGAGSKDPAKAQELYDLAVKDGGSPAERYVLLMKGAEIAAAGGDLDLSLSGIDTLDSDYEIAALALKQKLLDKFIIAAKPDQAEAAIPVAEQLVDQAMAADQYDTALMFADAASSAATKAKIATRKEVEDRLSRLRRNIRQMEPAYAAAKKAQETLNANPADPEANLVVGRWRCFYRNNWSSGLSLLAKGSDEKLKSLAEAELGAPADAERQVQLADGWWDLAQKEVGVARDALHLHAREIYQTAIPNLASALKKATIEKRLAEIANVKPIVAAAAANSSTVADKPTGAIKFPLNQWVDVLRLVDTKQDVVAGKWSRSGTAIAVEPGRGPRIAIPVAIDGSYDLEVKFTRIENSDEIETTIPVGSRCFSLMLSGGKGTGKTVSGFDTVNGLRPLDEGNPTSAGAGDIVNGQQCTLLVKVRLQNTNQASVDVLLNGKPNLPHWEGSPSALAVYGAWRMPALDHPGLGAWETGVMFSSARLKMVAGRASVDASVAESASPQGAPATATSGKPTGTVKFPVAHKTALLGGGGGHEFEDLAPAGGLLVGFRVMTDGRKINQLQPVYRTKARIFSGQNFGQSGGDEIRLLAKAGYAVGAIVAKTGGNVDGFKAVFMRVRKQALDPNDSYESEWLGGRGGGGETLLSGEGNSIVGVYGRYGSWVDAIGLIFEERPASK